MAVAFFEILPAPRFTSSWSSLIIINYEFVMLAAPLKPPTPWPTLAISLPKPVLLLEKLVEELAAMMPP